MKKKVYLQNLGMIITERCNLNCDHCLRGGCSDKMMSDEVIDATLNQVCAIGCLSICGGEPLLALDRIEKIFISIVEKQIIVDQVAVIINGTIYKKSFLEMLDYINEYISSYNDKDKAVFLNISYDLYHIRELRKLGLKKQYMENVHRYSESPYFDGVRDLSGKIFREGNAQNLDLDITVPLKPMDIVMTYVGESKFLPFNFLDKENGLCNIGPGVTVNVNGTITECDAAIENQEKLYNYGNVLIDSIEEVCLNRGVIVNPRKWHAKTVKIMKRYATYDR